MITIQQKLFRLLKIFSPAMQDQKLASPVVASLQGEEQPVAAVLRLSHQVQAGSVFQADKVHWHGRLSLSPRLEDKLTLATEEGTKLVQQFILLWRSTKTDMRISMVK